MFFNQFCQSSFADHKSSKLQSVNIGFDFDVKKSIDPEIQENLEACIVTTTTSWEDVIGLDDVKRGLKASFLMNFLVLIQYQCIF